jgi:hypothetical protein
MNRARGAALKLCHSSKAVMAMAALGAAGLLCGCAALGDKFIGDKKANETSGALLVVRLVDRLEPPAAVQVDVGLLREGSTTSVTARRQQSVPGRFADYLVALALPPQRYVITAIRDAGLPAADPAALLLTATVPFEVKPGAPMYLGRLVIAPAVAGGAAIEARDHYEEDTLLFRSAVAALRGLTIGRSIIANSSLASASTPATASASPAANKAAPGLAARRMTADMISPDADAAFTQPARDAFAKFLRLRAPRAFAIGDDNARSYAYFEGAGAVERAMRECARQAQQRPCRLFAVDDTLLSP